ncbi:hypothetical protein NPX13_g9238 [Xylaria arbuscula]|uniref:Uncharacterized protein n=1 Tax=Xylaria arbuscula TaxID=114810 RepID=A0A9W8N6Y2_9PEZI|nr:hypothetical protein NPX13_g9238 [Xylaria arbuscula]
MESTVAKSPLPLVSSAMSVEFDNILNFRDVGKTVNDFLGKKVLREGVLYRSARPDDATISDRRRLKEEVGIRTDRASQSSAKTTGRSEDPNTTPIQRRTRGADADPRADIPRSASHWEAARTGPIASIIVVGFRNGTAN